MYLWDEERKMANNKHTPCVILPGIGQSKVEMLDGNGNKVKMAWPLDFDTDQLLPALKGPMMKMMLFRKDMGFTDTVAKLIREIADPLATNPDGTMKNPVRVVSYPYSLAKCSEAERKYIYRMVPMQRLSDIIGEENVYFFSYNSFGQPYETAKLLDEFIQQIKAETGSDKVNLIPVSMGGALSTAYFDAYGDKHDVKRVLYFVAALEGSKLIADILAKNIKPENGLAIVELLTNKATAEKMQPLIKMMPEGIPGKLLEKALDALIDTAIVNSPSLWSVVPPQDYPALAEKYLASKPVLKAQTDRFCKAQARVRELITEQKENGTEFFACVGYGLQLFSLAASDKLSSDTIIHLASTTLGATAAAPGEKLDESLLTENSILSPDGDVDASTGFLPDATWYFKGQVHDDIAYNDTALNIAARVLSDDTFKNVHSDPAFPQFGLAQDNRKK